MFIVAPMGRMVLATFSSILPEFRAVWMLIGSVAAWLHKWQTIQCSTWPYCSHATCTHSYMELLLHWTQWRMPLSLDCEPHTSTYMGSHQLRSKTQQEAQPESQCEQVYMRVQFDRQYVRADKKVWDNFWWHMTVLRQRTIKCRKTPHKHEHTYIPTVFSKSTIFPS